MNAATPPPARQPAIRCLIPDLPEADELLPWLRRIDANLWYTNNGPLVRELEQRLAAFVGVAEGSTVTLSSGMSALELGLRALGIGAGHRVLVPALTFPATALAVVRCGAQPVFGDVCAQSWMLTPAIASEALRRMRLDAVLPVAAFGCPLPAAEWDAFAGNSGVPVLADAAAALGVQSIGSRVHWAFSLHATKPMGIGEGGLFVSADRALVDTVRRLANFSFERRVVQSGAGTNAKLSEYAAAIGLAQLQRWPRLLDRRREVLDQYRRALFSVAAARLQSAGGGPPATLCVRVPSALRSADALAAAGIETRRWYLPPLTDHPAFEGVSRVGRGGSDRLPVTEELDGSLLGLPFHTRLGQGDVAAVVETLASVLRSSPERGTSEVTAG